MRIMVTGASGFVGSHAVGALLAAGHEVRALVRDPGRAAGVLAAAGIDAGKVEFVPGDMLDRAAVDEALRGCDSALHSAAAIGITGHGGAAEAVIEANVTGTRNVVGGAVALGLGPVVHVSSVGVFVPPAGPVISADGPLSAAPRDAYGRSKVAADRYARELREAGAPVTIVYPGGVCGPHQPTLDALMEGLAGGLGMGWPVPRRGGMSMIDVRDLAEGLARAATGTAAGSRLVLGGHFLTWPRLADLCDEVTGRRCRRFPVPAGVMVGLGALLDAAKRVRRFDYPLTRDAAEYMVSLVPTDDRPALDALGLELRPVEETLADSVRWLVAAGHLDPRKAGRLGAENEEST
ncbi:epimerase [Actinomadura craniellae]|uniref:Epimerase n=1 Tax=Actinomadura craniellae TaxID=2231787 RepID=A0A365GY02_9ACTN|nr:NAD-dependent epimerase/dehydratase family protein [Actinomadura craniellae]RAY11709.1 epimerase [Actinomadura craniellae]